MGSARSRRRELRSAAEPDRCPHVAHMRDDNRRAQTEHQAFGGTTEMPVNKGLRDQARVGGRVKAIFSNPVSRSRFIKGFRTIFLAPEPDTVA